MDLNLRLYENLLKNSDLFDIISVEGGGIMKKFFLSLFLLVIAEFIFELYLKNDIMKNVYGGGYENIFLQGASYKSIWCS